MSDADTTRADLYSGTPNEQKMVNSAALDALLLSTETLRRQLEDYTKRNVALLAEHERLREALREVHDLIWACIGDAEGSEAVIRHRMLELTRGQVQLLASAARVSEAHASAEGESLSGGFGVGAAALASEVAADARRCPAGARMSAAATITEIDTWLDAGVGDIYREQPLAQHWARVAKVSEEAGEAVEALIAWTGQNPRKPQAPEGDGRYALMDELADVALTAILAIQHFTKDADETFETVWGRLSFLHERIFAAAAAVPEESE